MAVEWTDPCARAGALRNAYYALLSGTQEVEVRTRTLDAEELVRFTSGDLTKLEAEFRAAEGQCYAASGLPNPNRRYAITAGSTRRWGWPGNWGCR